MARPKDSSTSDGRARQEAKYRLILDAALRVFAAKGYHESRISEIARMAGVADGTIYLYFKNKDDILISLFESHLEGINAGLEKELEDHVDPKAGLTHAIGYHLRLARDNPTLAQFITIELRRSGKFMKLYTKGPLTEYIGHFARLVEEGKAQGCFRQDLRSGTCAHLIFGALDHACVTWVNNPNREPEQLDELAEFVSGFVLRAVSAQS